MIFKKVLLSGKSIILKWLQWYLVSSILRSVNRVFISLVRVKNVINSTALCGGRQLTQKCVSRMGHISVFWLLATYLWPPSCLILPSLITYLFFSSLLTSHPCPWLMVSRWSSGQERLRWLPSLSHTSLNEPHRVPVHITGVFLGGGLTGHHAKYLRPTRFEMPNYVCRSFHDDVRGGSYCRGLTKCRIFSGNGIRLNQNESQAYLLRTFRQHEYWWEWVLNRVQSNC